MHIHVEYGGYRYGSRFKAALQHLSAVPYSIGFHCMSRLAHFEKAVIDSKQGPLLPFDGKGSDLAAATARLKGATVFFRVESVVIDWSSLPVDQVGMERNDVMSMGCWLGWSDVHVFSLNWLKTGYSRARRGYILFDS